MSKQKNKYDYLLKHFMALGSDKREALQYPCKIKDHVYATDTQTAIKIPAALLKGEYKFNKEAPNYLTIFKDKWEIVQGIKTNDLIDMLVTMENCWNKDTKECEKCSGSGDVHCSECGSWYSCDICGGTGEKEVNHPFAKAFLDGKRIKIGDHSFRPFDLNKILLTVLILQPQKVIYAEYKDEGGMALFIINGEIEILCSRRPYKA